MQCDQRKRKAADEEHEDVDAVEVFKDFHTSRKKGLSSAAREAIVSYQICFP